MNAAPLVLLPGLDGTGRLFRSLLAALPASLRAQVVAYPNQMLDLQQLAAHVLHQLPAQRVVLLAESFSGLVALTLLANAATRVHSVIFVGAFAEPPRPLLLRLAPVLSRAGPLARSAPSFLLRRYCLGPEANAAELNELRTALAGVSVTVLAQRLALVAKMHSFRQVPPNVPAFYLRASDDRLVPASCANWFQHRFKSCEVEEISGPHFLLQTKPRVCAEVILRIVQRSGKAA